MSRQGITNQRLVAVFLLGWLLLGFPLLSLFDRPDTTIGGIPVLIVYLSMAWAAIILLLAVIVERRR
jgi:hypothetical protein